MEIWLDESKGRQFGSPPLLAGQALLRPLRVSKLERIGAGTLIVIAAQHLTSRGIDQMVAIAGQAWHGLVDVVPVVGVDFFSKPTLDVPAGCRAAIEKSRH